MGQNYSKKIVDSFVVFIVDRYVTNFFVDVKELRHFIYWVFPPYPVSSATYVELRIFQIIAHLYC